MTVNPRSNIVYQLLSDSDKGESANDSLNPVASNHL